MKRPHLPTLPEALLTWLLVVLMGWPNNDVTGQVLPPAPVVLERILNQGAPQRSSVTNLSVIFSTNVTLTPGNLVLRHLGSNFIINPTNFLLSYDAPSNMASWSFPGLPGASLPDGNYTAAILANTVSNTSGQRLDGNADGRSGDPYVFDLFGYFGDWNGDRDVDFLDNYWFQRAWEFAVQRAPEPLPLLLSMFDGDADGLITSNDIARFQTNYFTVLPSQPGIFAALVNDNGLSPWDHVTSDPTIAGTVIRTNLAASLEARLSQAAPFQEVTLALTNDGSFQFSSDLLAQLLGVPLTNGSYQLDLQIVETNGIVSATFALPFTLEDNCGFTNGWLVSVGDVFPDSQPGTASFTNCELVLTEGDSFFVAAEHSLTIPQTLDLEQRTILCVTYSAPTFDTTSSNLMRDAFEAALVDESGRPLTFTIQGAAGVTPASSDRPQILPASPDAFFNDSDRHPPFWAPGTAYEPSGIGDGQSTILVDAGHLAAGTSARLILRLVNNDHDRATTVRVTKACIG